uniref:Uncharacterized protein n=1 Tax=Nymphaea colorata TaxID=210225 RepID=A0A5K1GBV6_9MAGN
MNGAFQELVERLVPEHARRQSGLNFLHPTGT